MLTRLTHCIADGKYTPGTTAVRDTTAVRTQQQYQGGGVK